MNLTINKQREKTRKLVMVGMLSGICVFLGLTGLGFITIPPVTATIMHVPVIIGALIEGPVVGALVGFVFGVFSIYQAFAVPTATSFIFWNPIIAVLPRILIGILSYYAYRAALKSANKNLAATSILSSILAGLFIFFLAVSFIGIEISSIIGILVFILLSTFLLRYKNKKKKDMVAIGLAAAVGTLTNTIGVLGLTYIIYLDKFAKALNVPTHLATGSIIAIGVTNGIPEIIASILISIPVVMAVQRVKKR